MYQKWILKITDSLMSSFDLDTWSINRVSYREAFSGIIWLSQGQIWSTTLDIWSATFGLLQ